MLELEEAVSRLNAAIEEWKLALVRLGAAQYKKELIIKLKSLAFLLDEEE